MFADQHSLHLLFIGSHSQPVAAINGGYHIERDKAIPYHIINQKQYFIIDESQACSTSTIESFIHLATTANHRDDKHKSCEISDRKNILVFGNRHGWVYSDQDKSWWTSAVKTAFTTCIYFNTEKTVEPSRHAQLLNSAWELLQEGVHSSKTPKQTPAEILITPWPFMQKIWNNEAVKTFATLIKCPLYISHAIDNTGYDCIDTNSKSSFASMVSGLRPPYAEVPICVNMPVTVITGKWRGYWGHVVDICAEPDTDTVEQIRIKLGTELDTLNPTIDQFITIHAITSRIHQQPDICGRHNPIAIDRYQIPVMPRFALLEAEAAGQFFHRGFIDNCRGLEHFNSLSFVLSRFPSPGSIRTTEPYSDADLAILIDTLKDKDDDEMCDDLTPRITSIHLV
ncbi:uncharacterized protein C8R40DRAFT_1177989 [Lentinula edodes]|uniref:uncharacterized protein n=1 Tax=Lentinula edodes TaxID=5353 RepID=UPI001E8DCF33|nr:uncharacterized protein C8R40DRAFT_1177989 [Lentinula edodes]KAH7868249.1 hypothetical protein C8R40DRAFT_1177989 [Lentinula edodes]